MDEEDILEFIIVGIIIIIGDYVKVWYRYGRKERKQLLGNCFLNKEYEKINISEKEIDVIDERYLPEQITIYHKNRKANLEEYQMTYIMNGKNLMIEKIK